jgi:hypothetical protein
MSKRFKDAIGIWEGGASNSLAVANALADAIREVREEGKDIKQDPACKLIADQLCQLLGLPNPLIEVPSKDVDRFMEECHQKASEPKATPA